MARKVNYLNNKDMLAEIHKSKNTFCSFVDPEYASYDIILPSVDKINPSARIILPLLKSGLFFVFHMISPSILIHTMPSRLSLVL